MKFKYYLYLTAVMLTFLLSTGVVFANEPEITAASAVVMEAKTGKIVYEKNGDERRPPASTTKIMTCLLALEKKGDSLDEIVTASERAATIGESSIWLKKGEKLKLEELLYGLMLNSGNDASIAIAEHVGGSFDKFVEMMNQKAKEIGAVHTHFANPNGLPNDDHYTTAKDLGLIACTALKNPKFAKFVSTKTKIIPWPGHEWSRHLINTNKLLWHLPGANGVKTGFTNKAGPCLVSSATRNGQQFVCVVLGSANIWEDSTKLLEYAFANFERVNVYEEGQKVLDFPVVNGMEQKVELLSAKPVEVVIPKGEEKKITKKAALPQAVKAPVHQGQVVGQVKIYLGDKEVGSEDLIAAKDIHPKTFLRSFIKEFWGIFAFMIRTFV